jgi:hypothetical protein
MGRKVCLETYRHVVCSNAKGHPEAEDDSKSEDPGEFFENGHGDEVSDQIIGFILVNEGTILIL